MTVYGQLRDVFAVRLETCCPMGTKPCAEIHHYELVRREDGAFDRVRVGSDITGEIGGSPNGSDEVLNSASKLNSRFFRFTVMGKMHSNQIIISFSLS